MTFFRNNTVVTKVRRVTPSGPICRVSSKSVDSDDVEDSTLRDNTKTATDDCDNDTGCGSSLNSSFLVDGGEGVAGHDLCVCEGCCCLEPCSKEPQVVYLPDCDNFA